MTRRVTLREAAEILGVSKEAVRKRVTRGTLASEVGEDGRRYVYVDAGSDDGGDGVFDGVADAARSSDYQNALIEALREEVAAWREEARRKDTIIMQMAQANATLAARVPELEAAREPRDSPTEATEEPGEGEVPPEEGRSWWRRIFG